MSTTKKAIEIVTKAVKEAGTMKGNSRKLNGLYIRTANALERAGMEYNPARRLAWKAIGA
jgi:hypothetical protein